MGLFGGPQTPPGPPPRGGPWPAPRAPQGGPLRGSNRPILGPKSSWCESWGAIYPPGEGGAKGLPIEETRLFPIESRDAASVLWRLSGIKTPGPVVPNDHKGQFNCGFLWEQRKTKGGKGRLIQPRSMGAKACRLVNPRGSPFSQ